MNPDKKQDGPAPRGLPPAAWVAIGIGLFTLIACSAFLWISLTQGFTAG